MEILGAKIYSKNGAEIGAAELSVKSLGEAAAVYISASTDKFIDAELGAVIELEDKQIIKWMADYRYKEYWCEPCFGVKLSDIPSETQCLIYQKRGGEYGVILPVVSEDYKSTLKGNSRDGIDVLICSRYGRKKSVEGLSLVYAEGDNPYLLLEKCTAVALKLLDNGCRLRREREFPETLKYLGWCSWDAFEIRVNENDLLSKCDELKKKKIPVKWFLLDDMWGEVRDFRSAKYKTREEMFSLMYASRLYSFNADPERFPNGLMHCIDKINEFGIKVGMWHPTTGYWAGIDKDGEIFKEHSDLLMKADNGYYIPSYEEDKAKEFYNAYHSYLRECGAEFVKIDNQSIARKYYSGLDTVGSVARQLHRAIDASAEEFFDGQMINCMGMASENMWSRPTSPVLRVSDDFQPENREWFTKHILQCSYNTLVQGQLYFPDWDMWWTDDGQAEKNSLLRAISGGPVYVSDKLDRSRKEILEPLCLTDGQILMCDGIGTPTRDCLLENPTESKKIFKLQNIANGCGILEIFNLDADSKSVSGSFSPSSVEGIEGEEFAVYEHFSKSLSILKADEETEVTLKDNDDFRLYIIVPLKNGNGFIGKTDKFISPKTVTVTESGETEPLEKGEYAFIENYELVLKEY